MESMLFLGFHGNEEDALALLQQLRALGVNVWCAANNEHGQSGSGWASGSIDAVNRATCVSFLIGQAGVGGFMKVEVNAALARLDLEPDLPIVPIALPDCARAPATSSTKQKVLWPSVLRGLAGEVLPADWRSRDEAFFRDLARRLGHQAADKPVESVNVEKAKQKRSDTGAESTSRASKEQPRVEVAPRVIPLPIPDPRTDPKPGGDSASLEVADGDARRQREHAARRRRIKQSVLWTVGIATFVITGWFAFFRGGQGTNPLANGGSERVPLVWGADCPSCVAVWNFLTQRHAVEMDFAAAATAPISLPSEVGDDTEANRRRFGEELADHLRRAGWRVRDGTGTDAAVREIVDSMIGGAANPQSIAASVAGRMEWTGSPIVMIDRLAPAPVAPPADWTEADWVCKAAWTFLRDHAGLKESFSDAHSVRFSQMPFWNPAASAQVRSSETLRLARELDAYVTEVLGATIRPDESESSDPRFKELLKGSRPLIVSQKLSAPDGTPLMLAKQIQRMYQLSVVNHAARAVASPSAALAAHLPLQMVRIPAGTFRMGDSDSGQADEKPEHVVDVRAFELSAFEVTRGQWRQVMGASAAPKEWNERDDDRLPANYVSWFDAVEFCNALSLGEKLHACYTRTGDAVVLDPKANGYRLPSEAEWEYACRADRRPRAAYSFGDDEAKLVDHGWFFLNSGEALLPPGTVWTLEKFQASGCHVHIVGERAASDWKLHDMHGNVAEWCEDWYHDSYTGAPMTGAAWLEPASVSRVIRGGSFEYSAGDARSAFRYWSLPSLRWSVLGFRPARSVTTD